MARVAKLDLNQINAQLAKLEVLHKRLADVESKLQTVHFQTSQLDFIHARPTFNNLIFTWTGATTTLSWANGWIKDKNAALAETGQAFSQVPSFRFTSGAPSGLTHNIAVPAGSLSLLASTYYWLGWDMTNKQMYALTDVTKLYTHHDMQIICQIFTGTAGQTGTVGGGGSQGGSDLSGARYKLF